eukprot:614946-Pelagomonas_calceolata.AAC.1
MATPLWQAIYNRKVFYSFVGIALIRLSARTATFEFESEAKTPVEGGEGNVELHLDFQTGRRALR